MLTRRLPKFLATTTTADIRLSTTSDTMKELAFQIPSGVLRERVQFSVQGQTVVGDLYSPKPEDNKSLLQAELPRIVFAGPLSSVTEQSTGAYGSALAKRGFACLSIDHRGFGESEGEPRQNENYESKIEDLIGAVDFMTAHSLVDATRIGGVGVCLGAAYICSAAVQDKRIKALGFSVPLFPMGGGPPSREGTEARILYETTGEVQTIPAASVTEDSAMPMQIAVDYYCDPNRALVRNYKNEVALMYREKWQEYNSMSSASQIDVPFAMIHGEKSFAKSSAIQYYDNLVASVKKEVHWINSLPHTDFYDNPGAILEITGILDKHFTRSLA